MDILTSIVTGGATGLLGTAIGGVTQYFQRRQQHRQEVELRRLDAEIVRAEGASAEKVAAIKGETDRDEAAWEALAVSHETARGRWSDGDSQWLVLVDVVRGLTRPFLTIALLAMVGVAWWTAPPALQAELHPRIVATLLYLSTASLLWWFGSRQIGPPPK